MNERIICCEKPSYINLKDKQLQIKVKGNSGEVPKIPIEDIGLLVIDNGQIVITSAVMQELQDNKVAVLLCNNKHMPSGLMLPIDGNSVQQERITLQLNAKKTTINNLWKQIIFQKIENQAKVLDMLSINSIKLKVLSENIKSGDKTNREALAAVYYWKNIFKKHIDKFQRDADGIAPNHFLNYGYSIVRSIMAKSIVSAGLSPTIGIFHKNKFNAFGLADDLMEPFRPFVDKIVYDMIEKNGLSELLNKEHKKTLLEIPLLEVISKEEITSLTLATQNTVNSFVRLLRNNEEELEVPNFKV